MLTVGTRIKIIAFVVIGLTVIVYIGLRYASLGPLVGLRGYYVVKVDLDRAGGIFPNAEVTYRGYAVGRVGALNLTDNGVEADLDIDDSAPKIPANARAVVADRSAVGEQYVDLRPDGDRGPYLADDSVIAQSRTQTPMPVQDLLQSIDGLASSVPASSLRTVVDELGQATQGQGPNLQILLDTSSRFTDAATNDIPRTTQLVDDGQTVLATQDAEKNALQAFGRNAELIADQLDRSDSDIRRLIASAPAAATQVAGLLRDTDPALGATIANLLTTSTVTLTRQAGLQELMVAFPAAVAAGNTVITPNGADFGMAVTFFDPPPCTQGYQGTKIRNGLDTGPTQALNTNARCTSPPSSGIDVRGSANAPYGGGVPPAAPAPTGPLDLPGLMNDTGTVSTGTGMGRLLGLDH